MRGHAASGMDGFGRIDSRAPHRQAGRGGGGVSTITVSRLDPARQYLVSIDGESVERIKGRSETRIEVPLDGSHDILVAAAP